MVTTSVPKKQRIKLVIYAKVVAGLQRMPQLVIDSATSYTADIWLVRGRTMPGRVRRRKSARNKTTRWIVAAVILCSALSCAAPVLYASDCSRWIAEYKQGILQKRAARRLRAAKFRLTTLISPAKPVHRYPSRRPMGPLEALRRFQIDCGDLESPALGPKLPSLPILPSPLAVEFPPLPPDLPGPTVTQVAESTPPLSAIPPLEDVPTTTTPFESIPVPSPVPEPGSWILVLTGVTTVLLLRRQLSKMVA